jgi:hypothetical protein
VIQNKAYGAKNKVFKLQGGQRYLTLITNIHALIYITYIYIYINELMSLASFYELCS